MPINYYSTNNKNLKNNFETALLQGLPPDYGLYMIAKSDIPQLATETIKQMKQLSYSEIAFLVLQPFLHEEIPKNDLKNILNDAYSNNKIPTKLENVTGKTYIMWLTQGPTYSFKDYAARFFARSLNYFLGKRNLKRTVIVATSGDTGGAVADALHGLSNVKNIVFFPKDSISEAQRRQMTTLGDNVYAFAVNGDFDICQSLAKTLLGDKDFAQKTTNDQENFTSANSISLGRLLPQAIYPFFAYSRIAQYPEPIIASIPSGNFGDMMGTVIAKQMALPIKKIICGVNANLTVPDFLKTGQYTVEPSKKSPSSAMIVSHPSNLARLIDFYNGHMYDEQNPQTKQVIKPGVIDKTPDLDKMRQDLYSIGISNQDHYKTIKKVYNKYNVILEPHGAVGWQSLEIYLNGQHDQLAVIYETADPGKFPEDIKKAINLIPAVPSGIQKQKNLKERIFTIETSPDYNKAGLKLSAQQIKEAKQKIKKIFNQ
ncbi:MAG: threonine synthase [Candidatus Buchananbacteria bacterium]|nr:threonine synthase [Candidatus Buchananbacteria bacterium]